MSIAQSLYENGWITYPRSDSPSLSLEFVNMLKAHIIQEFGIEYFKANRFSAKVLSQEAHEAIRPVDLNNNDKTVTGISAIADKIFHAIRKRAIASQMADCIIKKCTYTFEIENDGKYIYVQKACEFPGWKLLDGLKPEDLENISFSKISSAEKINVTDIFKATVRPWTQADFIKSLETSGIGRPSTYSGILNTLLERNYIMCDEWTKKTVKYNEWAWFKNNVTHSELSKTIGGEKKVLIPSELGERVYTFLSKSFPEEITTEFTKVLETKLDAIACGESNLYPSLILNFNQSLKNRITDMGKIDKQERPNAIQQILYETETHRYALINTKNSKKCIAQISLTNDGQIDDTKVWVFRPYKYSSSDKFGPEIVDLFKDDIIGTNEEGHDIIYKVGPYGPYLSCNGKKTACEKRPTLEEALEHLKQEKSVVLHTIGSKYKIIKNKYGISLANGNNFAKLSEDIDYKNWKTKDCDAYMLENKSKRVSKKVNRNPSIKKSKKII
tara:strand:- start:2433 stop:3932 length:1500 start_codon:yes stop_codon:yes gene_type:complete